MVSFSEFWAFPPRARKQQWNKWFSIGVEGEIYIEIQIPMEVRGFPKDSVKSLGVLQEHMEIHESYTSKPSIWTRNGKPKSMIPRAHSIMTVS